jgi:cell division protein FtsN
MAARKGAQAIRPGNGQSGWPAWLWLVLGVLLGLGIAGFAWMKDWWPAHPGRGPQPNPAAQAPQGTEAEVAEEKPKPAKPKYDFYSVLPEMEVVIPDAEVKAKAQEAKAQQAATKTAAIAETPGLRYWLQAGSFRETKQAEELKAKLALLGLRARVVDVTINGTTWYRVRIGPYGNAADLDTGKRTLEGSGMTAIALKEAGT